MFMIMGLSGSGKSTLLRCFNRLIEPTSGSALLDGENIFDKSAGELREMRRTRMSMVFQNFALLPHKTIAENVAFGLKVRGDAKKERMERSLEMIRLVGLAGWENHYPENLSGGMKQRVGLARALANDPDVLLMDEPFGALDPLIRKDMQDELVELQKRLRKTIIFITHDFQEAIRLGDQISIMKEGQVVQTGRAAELIARPVNDYVANFTSEIDRGRVFTAQSVMATADTAAREDWTLDDVSRGLRKSGRDHLFVLNGADQPVGYIRDKAKSASGKNQLAGQAMAGEFPRVSPTASLADIYKYCDTEAPLAVVGDDGRFLGSITARDILVQLAPPGRHIGV
jgi:glycine betaine/proline transport system ATP-binding protein